MKKLFLVLMLTFFCLTTLSLGFLKAQETDDYRLGENDLIEITVYQEPDLTKTVRVSNKGDITYPLLGSIYVKGLTAKELEEKITQMLGEDYLVNPQVSVFIKEHSKISVLGEVNKPGTYELKTGMRLMDAIALAGGLTPKSNAKDIKLIRGSKEEEKQTIKIDISQLVSGQLTEDLETKNFKLQPGDLIIVGQLGASDFVVVLGQVKNPGRYSYNEGMTAIEAIAMAGGLTDIAAANNTRVIRIKDGKKLVLRVPVLSILKSGEKDKDVLLQPQDTVVVPESFF